MKQPKSSRLYTEKHLEHLGEMLRILFEEETLTDVTLHCRDGSLQAHQLILAASSPYFRRIFLNNNKENISLFMHGISKEKLKKIIEVIYYGTADIPNEMASTMCDLVEELDIAGVIVVNENNEKENKTNGYGRDTRFKGQKRVAVDFTEIDDSEQVQPTKLVRNDRSSVDKKFLNEKKNSEKKPTDAKVPDGDDNSDANSFSESPEDPSELYTVVREEMVMPDSGQIPMIPFQQKLTSWDKKPRKFQCELCPSSFKRASHLTRHQLVHTGERPYACKYCDKAFSRHDKLKHHIKKNHDLDPDFVPNGQIIISTDNNQYVSRNFNSDEDTVLSTTDFQSIGTVRAPSPIMRKSGHYEQSYDDDDHMIYASSYPDFPPRVPNPNVTPNNTSENISFPTPSGVTSTPASTSVSAQNIDTSNVSNASSNNTSGTQAKKGRGRPRKYPPAPPQLVKRPRGRPRLNPLGPVSPGASRLNYDITNLPFGDLEYLTSDQLDESLPDSRIIEPLVEIKTDDTEVIADSNKCSENDASENTTATGIKEEVSSDDEEQSKEESVNMAVLEPVVSINETDKENRTENNDSSTKEMDTLVDGDKSEMTEKSVQDSISFLTGIGLCQKKTEKFGECTISRVK